MAWNRRIPDNEEGYILVNVVTANLPTSDRPDSRNLSYPKGTFIPDIAWWLAQGAAPSIAAHDGRTPLDAAESADNRAVYDLLSRPGAPRKKHP